MERETLNEEQKSSIQSQEDIIEKVKHLNCDAMSALGKGNSKLAKILFLKAEKLMELPEIEREKCYALFSLTYNNEACLYKREGKPNVALSFLMKALMHTSEKEIPIGKLEYAATLLNICAILSDLNKHKNALSYSTKAVSILVSLAEAETDIDTVKLFSLLGVAHYNMAAELEFTHQFDEAIDTYSKGLELIKTKLSKSHPIFLALQISLADSKRRHDARSLFHKERKRIRGQHQITFLQTQKPSLNLSDLCLSNKNKHENQNMFNKTMCVSSKTTPKYHSLASNKATLGARTSSTKAHHLPKLRNLCARRISNSPYNSSISTRIKKVSFEINSDCEKRLKNVPKNIKKVFSLYSPNDTLSNSKSRPESKSFSRPDTTPYSFRFKPKIANAEHISS